jgi:hypothetical protein
MGDREDIVSDARKFVGYSNTDRLMLILLEVLLEMRDKV